MEETWLDISVIKCPNCGKLYSDASWYIVELESDIECGICGKTFNTRKNMITRALLKITLINNKIIRVNVDRFI